MASINKRTTKGQTTYQVQIRLKGYPQQTATFKRLTDAKKWASDTESDIRHGRHFKTIESKKHTFAEMIDRYIEKKLPETPKSIKQRTPQLLRWKKELGVYLLSEITASRIVEIKEKMLSEKVPSGKKRSPSTVVRYMAALSHVFNTAVNEWEWMDANPMRKVKRPKEPRGRVRFLSDDERARLLNSASQYTNPHIYAIIVLALSTGMRQGEILNLKWNDMNLREGYLIIHESKNDERRRIPITGHALEILKKHNNIRRIDTNFIFYGNKPTSPYFIRNIWTELMARAEIEDFKFHDLRHSAASYLAMNGASLAEIAEILGHKTLQMVKRYAHLSDSHTSSVVASMNEKIFG